MEPSKSLPIADRLDGMEAQVRRLRGLAAILIVATFALGANAALSRPRPGRMLVAGGLEIRDADGRLRGTFGLDYSGLPGLKLYDQRGLEQVTLAIPSDDTSGLYFSDRGWPRIVLESSIEGTASLRLVDKDAKERAAMTLAPDGTPRLAVADGPDATATEATADAADDPTPSVDSVGPPPSTSIGEALPSSSATPRMPNRMTQVRPTARLPRLGP